MGVAVPNAFWTPIQHRVVRNTLGYLPHLDENGAVLSPLASRAPIVTYISRQSGVKKIDRDSQEALVKALTELEQEGVCELHVVAMEKTTFSEQLAIIAKTTVCASRVILRNARSLLQDHDRNTWYRIDGMYNSTSYMVRAY